MEVVAKNMSRIVGALNDKLDDCYELTRINFFFEKEGADCVYLKTCVDLLLAENKDLRNLVCLM